MLYILCPMSVAMTIDHPPLFFNGTSKSIAENAKVMVILAFMMHLDTAGSTTHNTTHNQRYFLSLLDPMP